MTSTGWPPAGRDGPDLGKAPEIFRPRGRLRQNKDNVLDAGMGLEGRAAPLDQGPAAQEGELLGPAEPRPGPGGDDHGGRPLHFASSLYRPKIILPTVVWRTEVTMMSTLRPIIRRALSTTTIVPSSRYATPWSFSFPSLMR